MLTPRNPVKIFYNMSATALDPTFVKALRLLQSKSKDSTAQLRAMLDEAIAVRKGSGTPRTSRSPTGSNSKETSRSVSRERPSDKERKEAEKRKDLDRLRADLIKLDPKHESRSESKRPRSPSSNESPGSPVGSESSQGEFVDLQMNIELDCTCVVCKSFNQESNNKLMECSSCQNLYHQECHDPPVSNSEASDPRLIWNCSRCSRTNPTSSSSSRSTSVEKTGGKPELKSSKSSSSSSSHKSSKHHKPSPSKASKHKSGHSSHSSSASLTSGSGSIQMTEAQKRLKLMKKQAAASLGKKKSK
ncbi:integrator complex subunit 12 [Eurytemora carolleeae]|uniref:integrator complex subunit 12 n=1 Tax=Eurytemora carolleeae TaxID=1294199 RepID=UPI000C76995B|nr:integrator complex subunit 12 [Eurytemora carolleeae]|eukprot:XP_023338545.1 integrator complex subunit 12-like [Eurytemora affinis]